MKFNALKKMGQPQPAPAAPPAAAKKSGFGAALAASRARRAAAPAAPAAPAKPRMTGAQMLAAAKAARGMKAGGLAAGHKTADGVAKKGKTDTKRVAMKAGGAVKKMAYGGKTC